MPWTMVCSTGLLLACCLENESFVRASMKGPEIMSVSLKVHQLVLTIRMESVRDALMEECFRKESVMALESVALTQRQLASAMEFRWPAMEFRWPE